VKRIIAAGFAGALIFSGTASAATPSQQIASLQRSVKALQKNVNTLKKTVAKQQKTIKTLDNLANASIAIEYCLLGATADALQSTWTTIDQHDGTTVFGNQQTISDAGACQALRITRQGIRTPPTTAVFSALVALLGGTRQGALTGLNAAEVPLW
jgi:hypothetical protein